MSDAMRKREREWAEKLAPEAVEPPEGLLERLEAEIPEELPRWNRPSGGEDGGDPGRGEGDSGDRNGGGRRVVRFPGGITLAAPTLLKAAATVALALGAGFLALQVQREVPPPGASETGLAETESAQTGTPQRPSTATRPPAEGTETEETETDEAVSAPAVSAPAVPAPADADGDPVTEKTATGSREDRAVGTFEPPEPKLEAGPEAQEEAAATGGAAGRAPERQALQALGYASAGEAEPQMEMPSAVQLSPPPPPPEGPVRRARPRATDQVFDLPKPAPQPQPEPVPEPAPAPTGPKKKPKTEPKNTFPVPVRDLEVELRDEGGGVLPGAVLHLEDAAGNERRAIADVKGQARFYDLPVGEYEVRAELEGFNTVTRRVTPPASEQEKLAMSLPLASVQEEIVVLAEAPEGTSRSTVAGDVGDRLVVRPGTQAPDAFGKRADRPPVPDNPLVDTTYDALSTFGLDVDTGSYGLVRRHLTEGTLPAPHTVRIEELLNAFDYGDPPPAAGDFGVSAQGAPSPFRPGLHLLRLGIKARVVTAEDRKPAALTFVVDVSGSMQRPDKLDLARRALGLLLDQLEPEDTVALVTYGSDAQLVLGHTADKEAVRRALDELGDGGSTNAEAGLLLGYEEARRAFRPGAVNRIVLCSDGVANVGATDPEALLERVGKEARSGLELTTLGFGMGTYNDRLMEQLADRGDGRYAYLDDLEEAHRVLVEELTGTVQTIARDARVQLELNPAAVKRYRLLGYENRDIADHRFRYDDQDAGEIGAGHAVTVLYELELEPAVPDGAALGVLRLRWWSVAEERFVEIREPIYRRQLVEDWDRAAPALRWAALTARFAQVLRGHAPPAELPELAERMQRVTSRAWPADDRRAELADLTRHAAQVHRELLRRSGGIRPAGEPQEP